MPLFLRARIFTRIKLGNLHFTWHKTRHNSAIGIVLGIKLGNQHLYQVTCAQTVQCTRYQTQ